MSINFIPQNLYDKIIDSIPIVCVDGIIENDSGVLLLLRDNEPEKNKWWFPGGRLLKGEKLEEAIIRKVKEETGLICEVIEMLDITQTNFKTGPSNIPVHTINVCFTLKIKNGKLSLNNEHKKWGWFKEAPKDSHLVIKNIFKKLIK
jgi:colanic acid biosynthesis protein WcaH|tara:strand:+ start:39 stop:479 length:441 start_codon:yes stop_codon:yes gene_type:complete